MANPRFLFDEDVSRILSKALRRREPEIDIICVGQAGGPPKKTTDKDLLVIAESLGRVLASWDRSTMPVALTNHFAKGLHTWGVILVRKGFSLARYIQEMLLVWQATSSDEWRDRTDYIPY